MTQLLAGWHRTAWSRLLSEHRSRLLREHLDGYADSMLAHDAPDHLWQTPKVARICATNPWGWFDAALAYAATGRERLTTAFLGVAPRFFAHGHYHVRDTVTVRLTGADHDTTLLSLANEMTGGNVALLDLDKLEVVLMPSL